MTPAITLTHCDRIGLGRDEGARMSYQDIRKQRCVWCAQGEQRIGVSRYHSGCGEPADEFQPCTAPTPEKYIEELEAENKRLRKALAKLPHEPACDAVTRAHKRGYGHLETDAECPDYHYEPKGPCNCAKSMQQERTEETND